PRRHRHDARALCGRCTRRQASERRLRAGPSLPVYRGSLVLAVFRSKRMLALFALGYSGGLPLYLTGQTLQSWLTDAKVDVARISAFAAVGLAYTFKFVWAPLLDRFSLPFG